MCMIEKYWGNYIGATDDSLTLEVYLSGKQKEEIPIYYAIDLINETLKDFAAAPLAYDVRKMVPEEHMLKIAAVCEELRQELYG